LLDNFLKEINVNFLSRMMTSSSSEQRLPPDLIQGVPAQASPVHPPTFSFMPIGPAPPPPSYIPPVRPVANNADFTSIKNFSNSSQYTNQGQNSDFMKKIRQNSTPPKSEHRRILIKRKPGLETTSEINVDRGFEPQRKVHLNEELVAQTMSNLYISHPRPKVARRNLGSDVAEAMNLNSLEDLEDKFSHQAAITNCDEYTLPPQRTRKLPNRTKVPQLRLNFHQELKSLRSTDNILPESILARYRPSPRAGSTAVVLWKPPSGCIPDVISSALRSGPGSSSFTNSLPSSSRSRIRCYSEVTSTPYSSHENLCGDSDMSDISLGTTQTCCSNSHSSHHPLSHPPNHNCLSVSPTSAEAPELSYNGEVKT